MDTGTECPKCGGTGFIVVEGPNVSHAKPCDCRSLGKADRLEERAQIPALYRNSSFDNFNAVYDPSFGEALKASMIFVRKYANEFLPGSSCPGLLLIGAPGTGKTHLAVAALRRIIQKWNLRGVFCDYQNLLDRIRSGYDPASNSSDKEAYRIALDAEILLLDDLGAHRVTDWVEDTITSIITQRCNNNRPLIATTNLADSDITGVPRKQTASGYEYGKTLGDYIGERARSRLFEMCRVHKMGTSSDYRLRKVRPF